MESSHTHMHINAMSQLTAANRRQTGFIYGLYGHVKYIQLETFDIAIMLYFVHTVL